MKTSALYTNKYMTTDNESGAIQREINKNNKNRDVGHNLTDFANEGHLLLEPSAYQSVGERDKYFLSGDVDDNKQNKLGTNKPKKQLSSLSSQKEMKLFGLMEQKNDGFLKSSKSSEFPKFSKEVDTNQGPTNIKFKKESTTSENLMLDFSKESKDTQQEIVNEFYLDKVKEMYGDKISKIHQSLMTRMKQNSNSDLILNVLELLKTTKKTNITTKDKLSKSKDLEKHKGKIQNYFTILTSTDFWKIRLKEFKRNVPADQKNLNYEMELSALEKVVASTEKYGFTCLKLLKQLIPEMYEIALLNSAAASNWTFAMRTLTPKTRETMDPLRHFEEGLGYSKNLFEPPQFSKSKDENGFPGIFEISDLLLLANDVDEFKEKTERLNSKLMVLFWINYGMFEEGSGRTGYLKFSHDLNGTGKDANYMSKILDDLNFPNLNSKLLWSDDNDDDDDDADVKSNKKTQTQSEPTNDQIPEDLVKNDFKKAADLELKLDFDNLVKDCNLASVFDFTANAFIDSYQNSKFKDLGPDAEKILKIYKRFYNFTTMKPQKMMDTFFLAHCMLVVIGEFLKTELKNGKPNDDFEILKEKGSENYLGVKYKHFSSFENMDFSNSRVTSILNKLKSQDIASIDNQIKGILKNFQDIPGSDDDLREHVNLFQRDKYQYNSDDLNFLVMWKMISQYVSSENIQYFFTVDLKGSLENLFNYFSSPMLISRLNKFTTQNPMDLTLRLVLVDKLVAKFEIFHKETVNAFHQKSDRQMKAELEILKTSKLTNGFPYLYLERILKMKRSGGGGYEVHQQILELFFWKLRSEYGNEDDDFANFLSYLTTQPKKKATTEVPNQAAIPTISTSNFLPSHNRPRLSTLHNPIPTTASQIYRKPTNTITTNQILTRENVKPPTQILTKEDDKQPTSKDDKPPTLVDSVTNVGSFGLHTLAYGAIGIFGGLAMAYGLPVLTTAITTSLYPRIDSSVDTPIKAAMSLANKGLNLIFGSGTTTPPEPSQKTANSLPIPNKLFLQTNAKLYNSLHLRTKSDDLVDLPIPRTLLPKEFLSTADFESKTASFDPVELLKIDFKNMKDLRKRVEATVKFLDQQQKLVDAMYVQKFPEEIVKKDFGNTINTHWIGMSVDDLGKSAGTWFEISGPSKDKYFKESFISDVLMPIMKISSYFRSLFYSCSFGDSQLWKYDRLLDFNERNILQSAMGFEKDLTDPGNENWIKYYELIANNLQKSAEPMKNHMFQTQAKEASYNSLYNLGRLPTMGISEMGPITDTFTQSEKMRILKSANNPLKPSKIGGGGTLRNLRDYWGDVLANFHMTSLATFPKLLAAISMPAAVGLLTHISSAAIYLTTTTSAAANNRKEKIKTKLREFFFAIANTMPTFAQTALIARDYYHTQTMLTAMAFSMQGDFTYIGVASSLALGATILGIRQYGTSRNFYARNKMREVMLSTIGSSSSDVILKNGQSGGTMSSMLEVNFLLPFVRAFISSAVFSSTGDWWAGFHAMVSFLEILGQEAHISASTFHNLLSSANQLKAGPNQEIFKVIRDNLENPLTKLAIAGLDEGELGDLHSMASAESFKMTEKTMEKLKILQDKVELRTQRLQIMAFLVKLTSTWHFQYTEPLSPKLPTSMVQMNSNMNKLFSAWANDFEVNLWNLLFGTNLSAGWHSTGPILPLAKEVFEKTLQLGSDFLPKDLTTTKMKTILLGGTGIVSTLGIGQTVLKSAQVLPQILSSFKSYMESTTVSKVEQILTDKNK